MYDVDMVELTSKKTENNLKIALSNKCRLVCFHFVVCRHWPELTDREHDEDDGTDPSVIHGEVLQRSPLTAPRLPRHN